MSNVCSSSSARCSKRARTSPAARLGTTGSKPSYDSRSLPTRASSASPAARAGGPTAPSRSAAAALTTPISGSRSWKDALKSSSRQLRAERCSKRCDLLARRTDGVRVESERAPSDTDGAEEEAVARQEGVEAARAFGQRGEAVVAGGQPDPGAHGGDVVQMAPHPLELQQDRASAGELGSRKQTERLLAGVGIGDAVRDRAGGAGARRVGEPFVERLPFGGSFKAAVLVEELGVQLENAVADDVKAEVAGLDHAGVDRTDGDLEGVVAAERHPAVSRGSVVDERPQRLVTGEAYSLEVVRLALVPAGGGREIDDRRRSPFLGGHGFEPRRAARRGEERADARAVGGRVQPGEAPAARKRLLDPLAVGSHESPRASASTRSEPGSPTAAAARPRSSTIEMPVSAVSPRSPATAPCSRGGLSPAVVSISACASPRKPSASRSAVAAGLPRPAGLKAAGDDQHLADEERRGRQSGERRERDRPSPSRARACCGRSR